LGLWLRPSRIFQNSGMDALPRGLQEQLLS